MARALTLLLPLALAPLGGCLFYADPPTSVELWGEYLGPSDLTLVGEKWCVITYGEKVKCQGDVSHPKGDGWVSVHGAVDLLCVLDDEGRPNCGGSALPQVPDGTRGVVDVSAYLLEGCFVYEDGRAECWSGRNAPLREQDHDNWRTMAYGASGRCGIRGSAGKVTCPHIKESLLDVPDSVEGSVDIAVGDDAVCVVRGGGDIRCWGDGPEKDEAPAGDSWVQIEAGSATFCALDDDGGVACWGRTPFGDGKVPDSDGHLDLAVSSQGNACAIDEDGEVDCW